MDELPAAFKAAAAVLADRDRPPRARKGLSVRTAAAQFNLSSSAVQRAISSLQRPDPIPRSPGRPRSLTNEEDEALVAFVKWLHQGGFPATKSQLVAAANELRRRRDPGVNDLGRNWYNRWLIEHPEIQTSLAKVIEESRKSSEASRDENLMTLLTHSWLLKGKPTRRTTSTAGGNAEDQDQDTLESSRLPRQEA